MSYRKWFEEHAARHAAIVSTLSHLDDAELIEYFDYENMRRMHPEFCPLYKEGTKCHDMEKLNCYMCACPYFRFDDAGAEEGDMRRFSSCSIEAKDARTFRHENSLHNDCSHCLLPHRSGFVAKHFSRSFREMMEGCDNSRSVL